MSTSKKTDFAPSTRTVTLRTRGAFALGLTLLAYGLAAFISPITAAAATPGWLDRFNAWRAVANVPAVTENATWSQGDYAHALYMVKNDQVTHYELSTLPYYTVAGDTAARNGNIQVSSTTSATDNGAIDWWMAAPFHELGMMDPRLTATGFGSYREVKSGWQAGFAVDVLRGNSFTGGQYPAVFPGDHSGEPLTSYNGGESPDPLQGCPGYAVPTGLPITIQVGANVATVATAHSLTANGVALDHCVIDSTNAAVGSNLLSRGAVIVIPRQPLQNGTTYQVSLTVNATVYIWSFTVGSGGTPPPPAPAGWTSVGGLTTSQPSAASSSSLSTDLFMRGQDLALWHRSWNGTQWGSWQSLGGVLTSKPGAAAQGTHTDVFGRGTDGQLWTLGLNSGVPGPWRPLGGGLTSGPAADAWTAATYHVDVFVRGTDGQLWHKFADNGVWYFWEPLGGGLTSDPGAASWGPGRIDVFVRGTDYELWHKWFVNGVWYGWEPLGGVLASNPDAASCSPGHLDVVVLGSDTQVWRRGYNGASWTSWQPLGAYGSSGVAVACAPGSSSLQVFARVSDTSIAETLIPAS